MLRKIKKWLKRLKGYQPSWSDKKHHTTWLFENVPELNTETITRIYITSTPLWADGKYLEALLADLRSGLKHPCKSMVHDTQWVEDELGEQPIGIYAQVYIVKITGKPDLGVVERYGSVLSTNNMIEGVPSTVVFKQYVAVEDHTIRKYFTLVYPY